jgi:hypothetical protein
MDINYKTCKKILPLLFGVIFFLNSSCEPKDDIYLSLDYEIPVDIYPATDTYRVGDTLTIKIQFNKYLTDRSGEYSTVFENFDFQGEVGFLELSNKNLTYGSQPGAFGKVNIQNKIGSIEVGSDTGALLNYDYDGENYTLVSKFILNRKGMFSLVFYTSNSVYNTDFKSKLNIEGKIANIKEIYYKVNDGKVNNNYLIFENTATNWDDNEEPNNWHRPSFSFKVVEKQ